MSLRHRRLLAALALALSAGAAGAADPFYTGLLEAGTRDYLRNDYETAAGKLRIACFGLLDEPPLLAEGLIRLALAQAGAGLDEGFTATFERLVEAESRLGAYSALASDTPFKIDFERELALRVSAAELARLPAFARATEHLLQPGLTSLPSKRQRRELEWRLAADPTDSEALVLLTRLEIAQGKPQRAERRLAEILAADPENRTARCVRGQMRLRAEDCSGALEDLPQCSAPPTDVVLAARYLRCLIAASDWGAAGRYLANLPLEARAREEITELVQTLPPATLESTARAPDADPEPPAEAADAPDPARAEELRRRAGAAASREELAALFDQAAELAGRFPDDRELQYLAAEIAYRRADWAQTARFFRRGGVPEPERPLLRFYLAVALFETGETAAAAAVLESTLPMLEPTPFVERYRTLILGSGGPIPSP